MNKSKDIKLSDKTVALMCLALLLHYSSKLLTKLTQYFPFSLVSEHFFLHYKNRYIVKFWDILRGAIRYSRSDFIIRSSDEDEYFVYINGNFKKKIGEERIHKFKSYVEKKIGEGCVFFTKQENNTYSINAMRRSLIE